MSNKNRRCKIKLFWKIFRESFIIFVVAFSFNGTSGFNFDLNSLITFNRTKNSFFGFAVTGYIDENNEASVLVGAPTEKVPLNGSNYTGGAVYQCNVKKPDECNKMTFPIHQNRNEVENRTEQWLGATLVANGFKGVIMACAPRYWVENTNYSDINGYCYSTKKGSLNFSERHTPCRVLKQNRNGKLELMETGYKKLGSCQAGFSAAISKDSARVYMGAVGSYEWKGTVFAKNVEDVPSAKNISEQYSNRHETYIGYSMTSLNFFATDESGVAVGMPRSHTVFGQVALFTKDMQEVKILNGAKYPEYFGYSMCTSDVDGDGAEDLIVSAPMYADSNNDYEKGRIYIYYQGNSTCQVFDSKCKEKIFSKNDTINGIEAGARFGSSVASLGDINKDGFEDIAVSAPYEGFNGGNRCVNAHSTGAIYIYLGSKDGLSKSYSQVIRASDINHSIRTSPLNAFGYSLSGGLDLDNNQYPDLVVGAYESDTVFLFKSRPVLHINANFSFSINTTKRGKVVPLARNTCGPNYNKNYVCVELQFCLQYNGTNVENQIKIITNITLDTKNSGASRMRFLDNVENNNTLRSTFTVNKTTTYCEKKRVYIDNTKTDMDKVTPLEAKFAYELIESKKNLALSNILNHGSRIRTDSFNISRNCGEDDICNPDLSLTIVPNPKQYDPQSGVRELQLQILIKNSGEESYGSQFILKLPRGLEYARFIDTSEIDKYASPKEINNTFIVFNVGNPLEENQIVNFTLVLSIDENLQNPSSAFTFRATVNSTDQEKEENLENNEVSFEVPINEIINLYFQSESSPPSYYNHSQHRSVSIENDTQAGPKAIHHYIIRNSGTANLTEIRAKFFWPIKMNTGKDLLYLMDQPITEGPIKCDYIPNVNHRKLNQTRLYQKLLNSSNSNSIRRIPSENTGQNKSISNTIIANTSTYYEEIRCTISNLSRGQEVSIVFPAVVWIETIKKIAGLTSKPVQISSYLEVNVIKSSRNVTSIPNNIVETITVVQIIKVLQPDVIPLWIVGSPSLGVFILMLMIFSLYKLGFFKRSLPPTIPESEAQNCDDFTSEEDEKYL